MTRLMSENTAGNRPIRVMIVDDSAMIRKVLTIGLSADPKVRVVGTASNAATALEMVGTLRPDVITLDIEMPGMDGVGFLRELMPRNPVPTVVISGVTRQGAAITMQALEAGAVDIIPKPSLGVGEGLPIIMAEVCRRVVAAAGARPVIGHSAEIRARAAAATARSGAAYTRLLAIGASTGGVQALGQLLPRMPKDAPGILIVQHMPEGFTAAFATRLNAASEITVREARDGDAVEPGVALIAPGGKRHMILTGSAPNWRVALTEGEPVCFSRPSVDVLFESVAVRAGMHATAALLTGMGRDGASGLSQIRATGGHTVAQDEASSVVWGMPQAAIELGAAADVLPLDQIADALLNPPPAPAQRRRATL